MINFLHSGNLGDIIMSLAAAQDIMRRNGSDKLNYYLKLDQPAYYGNMIHPLRVGNKCVSLNKAFADSLLPLLRSQSFIAEADIYTNQPIDYDLDQFRKVGINTAAGYIARYYNYAFLCNPDLSARWLEAEADPKWAGRIIVNRTQRFHGKIDYSFLKGKPNVFFMGLPPEHIDMQKETGPIPHLRTKDYLQVARAIKGCRFFIGNSSSCFAVAEALKAPRLLEVNVLCPNVIPHYPNGWDAITQDMFEATFDELMKTTS